VAARAART
jgi:hypothetical protein